MIAKKPAGRGERWAEAVFQIGDEEIVFEIR